MKDPHTDAREAVALFRYGLIAELVNLPRGKPGMGAKLRAKAKKTYVIPGTRRTRVPRKRCATGFTCIARAALRRWFPNRAMTAAGCGVCRRTSRSC